MKRETKDKPIESRPHKHRQVILMPYRGSKTIVSRDIEISLPHVSILDKPPQERTRA